MIRVAALMLGLAAPAAAAEIAPPALDNLPPADVVILGELHDNPIHHRHQARAVAALAPRAIVFEMLTPAQAARITPANRDDPRVLAEALDWTGSGWPDFAMYHPIVAAAPQARILGGGLPRDEVRRAFETGAAAVFGPEAARYGLDLSLSGAEQDAREAEQASVHCDALPAEILPGMVAAQRLRDATLARAVVQAARVGRAPVIVITGNGHARRDRGIPAYLARAAPELSVLSIGQFEAAPKGEPPFDLWLVTAPAARDDPCAAFGAD